MPYCCYRSTVLLYQRPSVVVDSGSYVPHDQVQSQWNLMGERWTDESIEFAALAPFVQHDGRVYELVRGRVIWRNGRWVKRRVGRLVPEDDLRLVPMKSVNAIDAPAVIRYDEGILKQGADNA